MGIINYREHMFTHLNSEEPYKELNIFIGEIFVTIGKYSS
jgi:hypothetical protein